MKIDPSGISSSPLIPKQPVQPNSTAGKATTDSRLQDYHGYTPSPELTKLIEQVKEQPDVRETHIQSVMERLKQGYYSRPEVAMKTAEAMLNSLD